MQIKSLPLEACLTVKVSKIRVEGIIQGTRPYPLFYAGERQDGQLLQRGRVRGCRQILAEPQLRGQ